MCMGPAAVCKQSQERILVAWHFNGCKHLCWMQDSAFSVRVLVQFPRHYMLFKYCSTEAGEFSLQLLRELQQHRLFSLVDAALRSAPIDRPARLEPNGHADGAHVHGSSLPEHSAERMTVYLLLAPKASWGSAQSKVELCDPCNRKGCKSLKYSPL